MIILTKRRLKQGKLLLIVFGKYDKNWGFDKKKKKLGMFAGPEEIIK